MARKYPKFLWSNPTNIKSEGPFIVHTQKPRFLAKPYFDNQRNLHSISVLEMWDEDYEPFDSKVLEVQQEIYIWFDHSGRSISIHPHDNIIWEISRLEFLKDNRVEFTVEQAREIVRILFSTKPKGIYKTSSSYGFKHLMERISGFINKGNRKYCSNDTMIEAFKMEGFRQVMEGPNAYMNLSAKDVKTARMLFKG
ncbi:MAG: hypothetical protein JWQ25_1026 [Daejeonella sp.]|nr:hypothetical protein [Daejeonella sp.]